MDAEAIKSGLISAGIPHSALKTTLPLLGHPELRTGVESRKVVTDARVGYLLWPETAKAYPHARAVFYALAKECFLAGVRVYVVSLPTMIGAVSTDEYPKAWDGMEASDILFVTDFYEHGAPQPFSGQESARLRAYIKRAVERGKTVALLSDSPPKTFRSWYPESFIEFLTSSTEGIAIRG